MTIVRRVRIVTDCNPESPREGWEDPISHMVCWYGGNALGDEHDYDVPSEFRDEVDLDDCVVLPLYLYDHSGFTIRTTPFDCPWDSGRVGWIYYDAEAVKREFAGNRERAEEALLAEVAVYDDYISGRVYGYIVEEFDGDDWEHVDSCWGFYGDDIHTNGIADCLGDDELVALAESADIE